MAYDFSVDKIAKGTVPYWEQFHAFVQRVQDAFNTEKARVDTLENANYETTGDFVGKYTLAATSPTADKHVIVAYPNGTTLANASYPDAYPLFSATGVVWQLETSGTTNSITAITHNGTRYIAMISGSAPAISADGETWLIGGGATTVQTAGTYNRVTTRSDNAAISVAVGNAGLIAFAINATSATVDFNDASQLGTPGNGIDSTWTGYDVKSYGGTFYAVFAKSTGVNTYQTKILSSTDGDAWTTAATINDLYGAVAYNGTYVMLAGNGIARSTNLTTWTKVQNTGAFLDIQLITGVWVAVGYGGLAVYSTDNGASWPEADTPHAVDLRFVRYDSASNLVVFGGAPYNGVSYIYTISAYPTVSQQNTGATTTLNDYAANGYGQQVVVANGGKIYQYAPSGGDFSVLETGAVTGGLYTPKNIYKLNDGSLVSVALNGSDILVYQSINDGATWSLENTVSTGVTTPDNACILEDVTNGKIIVAASRTIDDFELYTSATIDGTFAKKLDVTGTDLAPIATFTQIACSPSGTIIVASHYQSNYIANSGKIYVSTNGGEAFSSYTDTTIPGVASPSLDGTRLNVSWAGGYFIVSCIGNVPFMHSATGQSGSWTAVSSITGLTTSASTYSVVNFLNGSFCFVSSGAPTSVWLSANIASLGAAQSSGMTWTTTGFYQVVNSALITVGTIGAGASEVIYSANGTDWEYIGYASGTSITNANAEYITGFPFLAGDTFRMLNYTPNVLSTTFNIPWPVAGTPLPDPLDWYCRVKV